MALAVALLISTAKLAGRLLDTEDPGTAGRAELALSVDHAKATDGRSWGAMAILDVGPRPDLAQGVLLAAPDGWLRRAMPDATVEAGLTSASPDVLARLGLTLGI